MNNPIRIIWTGTNPATDEGIKGGFCADLSVFLGVAGAESAVLLSEDQFTGKRGIHESAVDDAVEIERGPVRVYQQ